MLGAAAGVDAVLGLTLAVGLTGVLGVAAITRLHAFKRDAGARCHLWFVLLLILSVAAPLFAGATIAAFRAEPVSVSSVAPSLPAVAPHVEGLTHKAAEPALSQSPIAVYRPPDPAKPGFPFARAFAIVWALGALVFLARVAIGVVRLRRLTRAGSVIESRPIPLRRVRVIAHPHVSIPVAIGYRAPTVLLPHTLLETSSADDVEHVVLHELEHLRRFDDVASLLQAVCMSLLWFNPFAYYIQRRIVTEREMACDEAVVRRLGKRHGYASTLWNVAISVSDSLAPAFSPAFASGSQTVNRVTNLLDTAHVQVSRRTVALAMFAVTTAFAGASIAAAAVIGHARFTVSDAASVSLADGTTLVVGGRNAAGMPAGDAGVYRGALLIASIPLPVPRWSTTLTRLRSGDVLVTGGMTPSGTTADVELFNARTRTFERVGRLHVARVAHTATLLADGTVLVAAGERAPAKLESSTEIYDPVTRTFRLTADGYGRISQTAIRIDHGDVLMIGGDPGGGRKNCSIIYSVSRHTYHDAGTLVRVTADRLTFALPNGTYITHTID